MATYKESLCCQETKKFSRELFEEQKSIRKSSGFQIACLKKPILHASLSAVNHLRGDSMENLDIVHIDLQDTSNILFWCIIIFRKVFANSFHHASYRNTKRLRNMKSAIWIRMTKYFLLNKTWTLNYASITPKYILF